MSVHISAIICTHNRAVYLKKAIESLVDQALPKELYEVIVVDNCSTDDTKATVDDFAHVLENLRYIYEPILGLSQSRNTGWQNAQGEYVAYIDDDAIACPEWLERIVKAFEIVQPRPGSVGGKIALIWEAKRPQWLCEQLEIPLGRVDWGENPKFLTEDHQWLGGGNVAYPHEILECCGGFSTALGRKGSKLLSNDEILLERYLERRNLGYYYDPGICVKHYVLAERLSRSWFYRRYFWQGISAVITEHLETNRSGADWHYLVKAITNALCLIRYPAILLSMFALASSGRWVVRKCMLYARLGRIWTQLRLGVGLVRGD